MTSTQPLTGKVALITGASKGIGAATALELASLGAKVVINYSSDSNPADELVQKIGTDKAIAIKANAGDVQDRGSRFPKDHGFECQGTLLLGPGTHLFLLTPLR
jgi:NAD(P)-dependent dehydrogenase (short-subunit alcohol dehydrogenase family)